MPARLRSPRAPHGNGRPRQVLRHALGPAGSIVLRGAREFFGVGQAARRAAWRAESKFAGNIARRAIRPASAINPHLLGPPRLDLPPIIYVLLQPHWRHYR